MFFPTHIYLETAPQNIMTLQNRLISCEICILCLISISSGIENLMKYGSSKQLSNTHRIVSYYGSASSTYFVARTPFILSRGHRTTCPPRCDVISIVEDDEIYIVDFFSPTMRFLSSTLAFAFCFLGLSSAQNIYDGCGVDKECLGYEPDNPAENACLEAQVHM